MAKTPVGFISLAGMHALQCGNTATLYAKPKLDHTRPVFILSDRQIENLAECGEKIVEFCDTCAHFRTTERPSEKYNPCAKGHKMKFVSPEHETDDDWGFYVHHCDDRKATGKAKP